MVLRQTRLQSRPFLRVVWLECSSFLLVLSAASVWAQQVPAPPKSGSENFRRTISSQQGDTFQPEPGAVKASSSQESLTVLVLSNGRLLEGQIRADQRGYHLATADSNHYFPREYVKIAARDLRDAHEQMCKSMVGNSTRRDLVLGHWCLENKLPQEAAEHFRAILKVDPSNREARVCLAKMEASLESANHTGARVQRASPSPAASKSAVASADESLERISGPAVREFLSGVQPILLSRCGSVKCHGNPDEIAFPLEHVRMGSGANRSATARNLAAVLKQLDPQFPSRSPLLAKGFQTHGGFSQLPGQGAAPAFQQSRVQRWVQKVVPELIRFQREESNRRFVNDVVQSRKNSLRRDSNVIPASAVSPVHMPQTPGAMTNPLQSRSASRSTTTGTQSGNSLGPLTDPFDPAEFNAQQHQR